MKKILLLLSTLTVISLFYSCNDDESTINNENNTIASEKFEFSYKGKNYSSEFYYTEDSTFVLKNTEADKIFNEVTSKQNFLLYVDGNKLTYYDNTEDFKSNQNSLFSKLTQDLPGPCTENTCGGDILLTKDNDLKGDRVIIAFSQLGTGIPSLRQYNFNDKLTSFSARATLDKRPSITFYRDDNYGGESITFKNWNTDYYPSIPANLTIMNIGQYRLNKKYTWNDQASSMKIYYE
ncbi:hypothetical protein OBK13_11695 [Empedobacter falsenii]